MRTGAEPGAGQGERPTVRIDPEMRALFRAWRAGPAAGSAPDPADGPGGAGPASAPAPDPSAPEAGAGSACPDAGGTALPDAAAGRALPSGTDPAAAGPGRALTPAPPLDRIRLRRDGLRPLVFEGIRLAAGRRALALPGHPSGLAAEIELFLAGDGRLAIRAALAAEPEGPVRGQHHAALVATPGELHGFLGAIDPVASLPDPRFSDLCPAAGLPGLAGTLRRDFQALAASLCGPGP